MRRKREKKNYQKKKNKNFSFRELFAGLWRGKYGLEWCLDCGYNFR